jgi:hypothetical protein
MRTLTLRKIPVASALVGLSRLVNGHSASPTWLDVPVQKVSTAVRSLVNIRPVFTSNDLRAIVVRGTSEQARTVEFLFKAMDRQAVGPGQKLAKLRLARIPHERATLPHGVRILPSKHENSPRFSGSGDAGPYHRPAGLRVLLQRPAYSRGARHRRADCFGQLALRRFGWSQESGPQRPPISAPGY